MEKLTDILTLSAERYADRIALDVIGRDGVSRQVTYAKLERIVNNAAGQLQSTADIKKGEHVMLLAENCPDYVVLIMAILKCGAVLVPVSNLFDREEVLRIREETEARVIVVSPRQVFKAENAGFEHMFGIDGTDERLAPINIDEEQFHLRPAIRQPADDALVVYTESAAGKLLGVRLSHKNIMSNLEGIWRAVPISRNDHFLSVLPLSHTFELTAGMFYPIYRGARITYIRDANTRTILDALKHHHVSVLLATPLFYRHIEKQIRRRLSEMRGIWNMLAKSITWNYAARWLVGRKIRGELGSAIRLWVTGGAPISPAVVDTLSMIGIPLLDGYGLTETSPIVSVNRLGKARTGSVGLPLDNVDVRTNTHDGKSTGEIVVKGPSVFPGYLKNDAATNRVIQNGWFFTGDVGHIDRNGFLYITGRSKNLIVTEDGNKIDPTEIRELLERQPEIREACIFSYATTKGEKIAALLVGGETGAEREEARLAAMEAIKRLPAHKRPNILKVTSSPLPKSVTGNIHLDIVREMFGRLE